RVADADGARDRVGVLDDVAVDDGGASRGLEAEHPGQSGRYAALQLLAVPAEVGRVVARVADGDEVEVRGILEHLDDLERGRLLALDAVVVDRVHEVDGVVLGEVTRDIETVVEVA